jgi:hypothetical protein
MIFMICELSIFQIINLSNITFKKKKKKKKKRDKKKLKTHQNFNNKIIITVKKILMRQIQRY